MKSSEVSIKTRSTPAMLTIQGQVTKDTTVKWPIAFNLQSLQSRKVGGSWQAMFLYCCAIFLDKKLCSTLSLFTQVNNRAIRLASYPGRVGGAVATLIPSRFTLQKPG